MRNIYANYEILDCIGDWDYRILNSFEVAVDGAFPGDDYMYGQASSHCARDYNYFYAPAAETWLLGDRLLICAVTR